jgi:hypothetical protein
MGLEFNLNSDEKERERKKHAFVNEMLEHPDKTFSKIFFVPGYACRATLILDKKNRIDIRDPYHALVTIGEGMKCGTYAFMLYQLVRNLV